MVTRGGEKEGERVGGRERERERERGDSNVVIVACKLRTDTTPPKEVLKNGRMTFIEAGFVPAAIVHVGVEASDDPFPVLSEEILKEAKSGLEAEVVVAKKREVDL